MIKPLERLSRLIGACYRRCFTKLWCIESLNSPYTCSSTINLGRDIIDLRLGLSRDAIENLFREPSHSWNWKKDYLEPINRGEEDNDDLF
jgi:hypothetical protein